MYIKKQGNYPVSSPKLKQKIKELLSEKGIVSDAEVSVFLSGKKKMQKLSKKYLSEGKSHNVLSFPITEGKGKFIYPPDGVLHLGEIVISYPQVVEEAKRQGKRIDDMVYELAEHGTLHLLGIHHD